MDNHLLWLIAGFVLVIAELVTGTFFLLVLGIAAFAAAAIAWAGQPLAWQAVGAAGVAVAGVFIVQHHRRALSGASMPSLDAGQPAQFESWTDRAAGHARVRYRDALWDAALPAGASAEPGDMLYVVSVDGNTLRVSKERPRA